MKDYFQQSMRALQLAGMSEPTQKGYTRSVRMLVEHYGKTPDLITEEELQDYFLYRKNVSKWSAATMRICYSGIKFFFSNVLQKDWHTLELIYAKREQRLPTVLSVDEVWNIINTVSTHHNKAYLTVVYSCGLRLNEGLNLQVSDILSDRMHIHVHRGKGAKDRYVPLPNATLQTLRDFWQTHRNPVWIFPSRGRGNNEAPTTQRPMIKSSVQGALHRALKQLNIQKKISIHTFRHSYATHLLEAGVNIRRIQQYLGHASLQTTMVYLHLTTQGHENACSIINDLMDHGKGGKNDND